MPTNFLPSASFGQSALWLGAILLRAGPLDPKRARTLQRLLRLASPTTGNAELAGKEASLAQAGKAVVAQNICIRTLNKT